MSKPDMISKKDRRNVYTVPCRCTNCFHKWEQEAPFGEPMKEGRTGIGIFIGDDTAISKIVRCPNCGSYDVMKVK